MRRMKYSPNNYSIIIANHLLLLSVWLQTMSTTLQTREENETQGSKWVAMLPQRHTMVGEDMPIITCTCITTITNFWRRRVFQKYNGCTTCLVLPKSIPSNRTTTDHTAQHSTANEVFHVLSRWYSDPVLFICSVIKVNP